MIELNRSAVSHPSCWVSTMPNKVGDNALAAPLLCEPFAGKGHRLADYPAPDGPSQPFHYWPLSQRRHELCLFNLQSFRFARRLPILIRLLCSGPGGKWRMSSAATAPITAVRTPTHYPVANAAR